MGCYLTAQLTADGAASTGDQDHLILDLLIDLLHIHLDRFSAQQILHRHFLHIPQGYGAGHQLVDTGQVFQLTAGLLADIQNIPLVCRAGAGDRHVDLIDMVFLHIGQDICPSAHHRHIADMTAVLIGVVVNDAADLHIAFPHPLGILQDHLPRIAGTDQHNPLSLLPRPSDTVSFHQNQPIGKTNCQNKGKLQQQADHIIREGHSVEVFRH